MRRRAIRLAVRAAGVPIAVRHWRAAVAPLYAEAMLRIASLETMAPEISGRALAPLAPEAGRGDGAIFDAILYPNRSLPTAGFVAVMTVVIAVNLFFGLTFLALGAWPIVGFCGLDVFLVWLAFKLSYRQGRLHERVRVAPGEMWVSRVEPSGHETRWRLQPHWTRVAIEKPVRHESQVRVTSKGRTLILGAFLSPRERGEFADALAAALHRARAG